MSIILKIAETKDDKTLVKNIVENHHSYVPRYRSVGRRIDWLIVDDQTVIGMIGIGSNVYPPPKDILIHLGMTKNEYRGCFNQFANNWRFCFSHSRYNLGSQVLRALRQQAPSAWLSKYGDPLRSIFTFVGAGKTGAVYKADNWIEIGLTAGLPRERKAVSMKWNSEEELKQLFVKPTGEDRKRIFVTDRLS